MASVTVYAINDDGSFDCSRTGDVQSVMLALDIEQKDFTMQPPPDNEHRWRWMDNKWIKATTTD